MAGLKFKILLDSISNTEVFREILIDEDCTFEEFYLTIIESFGMTNDQMASFYVSNDTWDKGEEITLMDMSFDEGDEVPSIEMNTLSLKERMADTNQKFILVYDFLSMWIFLIELIEVIDVELERPEVVLTVGEIPEDLKNQGPKPMDEISFESDFDMNGFDDYDDDDFGGMDFDNIDDYDI